VAGIVAGRVVNMTDDHLVELSITLVLAYGTYLLADSWHMSGIIATSLPRSHLASWRGVER